jgi:hypothetical protein
MVSYERDRSVEFAKYGNVYLDDKLWPFVLPPAENIIKCKYCGSQLWWTCINCNNDFCVECVEYQVLEERYGVDACCLDGECPDEVGDDEDDEEDDDEDNEEEEEEDQ